MKPSTNTLLEKIYYGDFSPSEQIMSCDPEYRSACRKVDQGIQFFSGLLSEEERKRFDQLIRSVQDVSGMEAYANFAFGFRTGIMMMQELNNLDEKQEPFSG